MRHATRLMPPILLGLLAAACSSSSVPEMESTFEADIGRASHTQILESVPKILNRHHYEIERQEEYTSSMHIYTRWLWREPLEDEVALGYTQAQTRIILEARTITSSRGDPMGYIQSPPVWRIRFKAENQLRTPMSSEWEQPKLTDMCREYIDRIAQELKTEFESRFR